VRGFFLDLDGVTRRLGEVEGQQSALIAELRGLAATIRRGKTAQLMLPRIAARYGGPTVTAGGAIGIDLDESWGPVGPADWLTLSNASGVDLHRCTVLVELRGRSGDIARDLHFVPAWPSGVAIYGKYGLGTQMLDETVGRQTVPGVEVVTISVWSDELSQESIVYPYAGAERDRDIARYCDGMQVQAQYRPFVRGLLWNTERGVSVTLKCVTALPSPRITVTFFQGGTALAWYWDFPRWDEGEQKTLDTGGKLPWDPELFKVVVSFPGTSYTHEATYTVP
jgi:hypothetical protein